MPRNDLLSNIFIMKDTPTQPPIHIVPEFHPTLPLPLPEMLAENRRRNALLQVPYDPITGEGCCGERQKIQTKSGEQWWLPVQMLEQEPHCAEADPHTLMATRIAYDFEYWCATCAMVRDKLTGRNVRLRLNAAQREVLASLERQRLSGKGIRMIILKARQWGASTLVLMYMAWIQLVLKRNWNCVICGHKRSTSSVIKGMYTKLLRHYPKELLEEGKKMEFKSFEGDPNTKIITGRDCLVMMGTAQVEDVVRGYDIAMAHLSEVAFWPSSTKREPEDVMRSIDGTILVGGLSMEVLESTANGIGSFFHKEWLNATKGKSDKESVFIPWYKIEIYRMPVPDDEVEALWKSMDNYERNLWNEGCTLEMIKWYHEKRKGYQSHHRMMAEFPTNAIEAFSTTGRCVFSLSRLNAMRGECFNPIFAGEIIRQNGNTHLVDEGARRFKIWKYPEAECRYVVGVDVGGRSEKADYSVISVIAANPSMCETVAQWRGHIDHDLLLDKAVLIAKYYRRALLVVESNTLETNSADSKSAFLLKRLRDAYSNLYYRKSGSPGFQTNIYTKQQLVNHLVMMVRDALWVEHDMDAIDELSWFEEKPGGGAGAIDGKHDDIVMSRAIALLISNQLKTHPMDYSDFEKPDTKENTTTLSDQAVGNQ